jgi:hypothetical protein
LREWLAGICDTQCIDSIRETVALVDKSGTVYLSQDSGRAWSEYAAIHAVPSSLVVA